MSVKFQTIAMGSHIGVPPAHHTFAKQADGSDKLLVILPGYGYNNDFPVLYYLRKAALELGYDVLSVEYSFQAAYTNFDMNNVLDLLDEVKKAVASLSPQKYQHICIAGKSLGTILAVALAECLSAKQIDLILLTPLSGSVQMAHASPTLAIIGTADALHAQAAPDIVPTRPNLQWRVFEGLNHSLEVPDDWHASLAVLPEIIAACVEFLA
ncbi:MAG: hypothetical protein ABI690_16305 [Chloroflexota bacterium]